MKELTLFEAVNELVEDTWKNPEKSRSRPESKEWMMKWMGSDVPKIVKERMKGLAIGIYSPEELEEAYGYVFEEQIQITKENEETREGRERTIDAIRDIYFSERSSDKGKGGD